MNIIQKIAAVANTLDQHKLYTWADKLDDYLTNQRIVIIDDLINEIREASHKAYDSLKNMEGQGFNAKVGDIITNTLFELDRIREYLEPERRDQSWRGPPPGI
jgi:hypothetical protein